MSGQSNGHRRNPAVSEPPASGRVPVEGPASDLSRRFAQQFIRVLGKVVEDPELGSPCGDRQRLERRRGSYLIPALTFGDRCPAATVFADGVLDRETAGGCAFDERSVLEELFVCFGG